jgi:hypothetical protein
VHAIRSLFAADAVYEIFGKRPLEGIDEISSYWKRNAARQQALVVKWATLSSDPHGQHALFVATFFDKEERENQVVAGVLTLTLRERSGEVVKLAERYLKTSLQLATSRKFHGSQVERAPNVIIRITTMLLNWLRVRSGQIVRWVLILAWIAGWALLILFLLMTWLLFVNPPDWIRVVSLLLFDPDYTTIAVASSEAEAAALAKAQSLVGASAAILGLLLGVVMPQLERIYGSWKARRGRSLYTIELLYQDHDLALMRQAYRTSERVIIFSGDFSFLRKDQELLRIFTELSQRRRITLISYKTKAEVEQELMDTPETGALLGTLAAADRIIYDSGLDVKCSLIEYAKRTQLLYKFRTSAAEGAKDMMCILNDTDESHYLLEAVNLFVSKLVSRGQPAVPASGP